MSRRARTLPGRDTQLIRPEPAGEARAGGHWLVYASGLVLVLAALAFDLQGFLRSGPLRYAVLLAVLFPLLGYLELDRRRRIRPARPADALLMLLAVYGLVGALAGKAAGVTTSYLPVFVAMCVAFTHFLVPSRPTGAQARRLLWWLMVVSSTYLALHAVSTTAGGSTLLSEWSYHHEKAFFIPLALASAVYLRRRFIVVAAAVLAVVIVVDNPAATYVGVAVAVLGTLVITGPRVPPRAVVLVCVLAFTTGTALYLHADEASRAASTYFQAVGKTDNTPVRKALLDDARQRLASEPLLGEAFAGELASHAKLSGQHAYVPAHNDYLELATGGGLVALALFVGWVIATNNDMVGRYYELARAGDVEQAQLLRTMLLAYNTFVLIAAANPMLSQVGLGTALFSLYALMRAVGPAESASSGGWGAFVE